MKPSIVSDVIGTMLKVMSLLLLVPGAVSAYYHETAAIVAFALTALLSLVLGILLCRLGAKGVVSNKDAFAAVSLGWLAATAFGSLPFIFLGLSPVDALFESVSGFSATGATILCESNAQGYYILNSTIADSSVSVRLLDGLAAGLSGYGINWWFINVHTFFGLLFWRSFQQLIGGLGIILMVVAIFPELRVAGRQLYRAETVGPSKDTIVPRAAATARILWKVYLLFNALEIILLYAAKMPLFDAVCTAFSTLATGGFSPQSSSIAAYNSPLIEAIVALFIILGMSSFTLHYTVLTRDKKAWLRDEEFRIMLYILAAATVVLTLFGGIDGTFSDRLRFASFQVISFMGTCGFVSSLDYDGWSAAAKMALIMVMLVGGCIGSTAGGIKVGRLAVGLKYAHQELLHMLHPRAVQSIRLGKASVQEEVLRPMLFYSFFYLAVWLALSLTMAMLCSADPRVDLQVVLSGIASCLGGVGPGFGVIAFDWSQICPAGKMVGFYAMYIGRLEMMPVFLLFMKELWRK